MNPTDDRIISPTSSLKLARFLKILLAGFSLLFLLILGAVVVHYATHGNTPPIRDARGRVVAGSIASLETVKLGGVDQYILIRGKDTTSPVLLFLHGGPGMPVMYLAHVFQRRWENHFNVVQWDRRGVGKSYNGHIPLESMNVEQLISDTHELVPSLRNRFHQEKIYIVGHSWGSYLGTLVIKRYPGLFHAYIGTGQLTTGGHTSKEIADIQDRFIRENGTRLNKKEAIEELDTNDGTAREKWLFRFGGELHNETSSFSLMMSGFSAPEYTLGDFFRMVNGLNLYSNSFQYNVKDGYLSKDVVSVDVPVYFFIGRYDYTTPFELAQEYFATLKAPRKKFVWFENSAHFPYLEEPEQFTEELKRVLAETNKTTEEKK